MMARYELHHGDCRSTLRWKLRKALFDSCVTDPPYELGFMGKEWDKRGVAFDPETWRAIYDRLKPGGHLLSFGGTRTFHRIACAIEDAGFEIRDTVMWLYGSGFPKSLDVSKAIDKSRGGMAFADIREYLRNAIKDSNLTHTEIKLHLGYPENSGVIGHWVGASQPSLPLWGDWLRLKEILLIDDRFDDLLSHKVGEKVGEKRSGIADPSAARRHTIGASSSVVVDVVSPSTEPAQQWEGWGTALKPAFEPIIVARKPLAGTVAQNVLTHGVGAINIDDCRVHAEDAQGGEYTVTRLKPGATLNKTGGNWRPEDGGVEYHGTLKPGRWPANIIHDGSEEVEEAFAAFGTKTSGTGAVKRVSSVDNEGNRGAAYGAENRPEGTPMVSYGDSGSASRFFYCAKANKTDRAGSKHPTVKPIALMRYLCRLVTPPGGTVLDPFAGSGSTLQAALEEGFNAVGIEREDEFIADIERRMARFRTEVA